MLPGPARLTNSREFRSITRKGHRAGRSRVVVHAMRDDTIAQGYPKVGFIVSKAVGNAVVRHRVARRLRHLMRERLDGLPPDAAVVVRALPRAAGSTSASLARDLDVALSRWHSGES